MQSNGIARAADFDEMMLRHPTERGIAIDHWAALIIDGDNFRVFATPGKRRNTVANAAGKGDQGSGIETPSVFIKDVVGGRVQTKRLAPQGNAEEVLRFPRNGVVEQDGRLEMARRENPQYPI